jgi:hypothetical protein
LRILSFASRDSPPSKGLCPGLGPGFTKGGPQFGKRIIFDEQQG